MTRAVLLDNERFDAVLRITADHFSYRAVEDAFTRAGFSDLDIDRGYHSGGKNVRVYVTASLKRKGTVITDAIEVTQAYLDALRFLNGVDAVRE